MHGRDGAVTNASRAREPSPTLAARYAFFACVALSCVGVAGPLALLVVWLGAANAAIAWAYAVNRAEVFGKRHDGSMGRASTVALLPYLLLVWSFAWLKRLTGRPAWHQITPRLYVGRWPRPGELPRACTLVVDVAAEFPEPAGIVRHAKYRGLPILNRHVPSAFELAKLVDALAECDDVIYVHCGAGRGRSAMVAAALLVRWGVEPSVEAAERRLARQRPGVYLHASQREIIRSLNHRDERVPDSHAPSAVATYTA